MVLKLLYDTIVVTHNSVFLYILNFKFILNDLNFEISIM